MEFIERPNVRKLFQSDVLSSYFINQINLLLSHSKLFGKSENDEEF